MRSMLLNAAKSFCETFSQKKDLDVLLSHFTEYSPIAIEHGDHKIAPFLGVEFIGRNEIRKYFTLINDLLELEEIEFKEYFVDPSDYKVGILGKGKWKWKATGKSWVEEIIYVLEYAEGLSEPDDERELKVAKYSCWADTGSLYMAQKQ